MRIMHVINNLGTGGAEILLKDSVNLLPDHSHLIVYLENRTEILKEFTGNVSFVCLHFNSWKSVLTASKAFRKHINEWKPDLIHSHLFTATLLVRFARPNNLPLISSIHSTYSIDAFQSKKALWIERLSVKRQDGIIAVSNTVLDDYLRWVDFHGPKWVLPNFVPEKRFIRSNYRNKNQTFRCVAVGTLKSAKNYFFLLKAFKQLSVQEIILDIYGIGPQEEELQAYIDKNSLNVVLKGHAPDIAGQLRGYDLFIQASSHEGFGISVLEAMALKLPVLISDIKVFREITNEFAHFFPLANTNGLSDQILKLKNDIAERNKFIEAAFCWVRKQNTEKVYKAGLLKIYSQLVPSEKNPCVA